ncbi:MAG: hypothetical protein AB9869_13215 [Verrucomicrobiia bacterium]
MAIDEYEGIPLPFEVEDEDEAAHLVEEMLREEGLGKQRGGVRSDSESIGDDDSGEEWDDDSEEEWDDVGEIAEE